MKAKIVRLETTEQGALGVLILDGEIFCCTLQPDAADLKRFHIPAGKYICKRFHGQKWPDTFEIICEGHTAVLFHSGNIEEHSEGCILLGASFGRLKGARAVLNSGATFEVFMKRLKGVDRFNLEIIDAY
ncbi:MAG: DUF5675 family protein [Syntrophales bacterium]|jgi:hypothetical protein|nr:DUF5675 family protein [Syntrophales bacterium]